MKNRSADYIITHGTKVGRSRFDKIKNPIGFPYTVIYSGGQKTINPDVEGNVLREIRKYKHNPPQIERILAERNLEVLSKLEKNEMTIHEAESVIYNSIVGSFIEENKCSELCVELIYGWGMQLEDWEVFNPKDIPEAIAAMRAISYAILDRENFIKSVFEKDKINYHETDIIGFLGDKGLNSLLIKALESEDTETVERAITSLRRLNNEKYVEDIDETALDKEKTRWLSWWENTRSQIERVA